MHLKGAVEASAVMLTPLSLQLEDHITTVLTHLPLDKLSEPLSTLKPSKPPRPLLRPLPKRSA